MEIRTYKVFKFNELTEKQKEKVLERYHDINVDHDWWNVIYEDAANIGLKITGFDLGRAQECDGTLMWDALEVAEEIIKNHGKECATHKTALNYIEQLRKENDENDSETRENTEYKFLHDLLEDYRVNLVQTFDYLTSKEAIIETLEANDYDFTEDGKID